LVKVISCELRWHPQGTFLGVKVDRYKSSKKQTTTTTFEILRMKEKLIPVESFEMSENVIAFAWEPQGTRFALIHGDGLRPTVSIYQTSPKVQLLKSLPQKTANRLYWSPEGTNLVFAGLGQFNGILEFFNCDVMESVANEEHYQCTNIEWDPTGRFVTTFVSYWKYTSENGYNIYNLHGQLVRHVLQEKFCQFIWRPRPKNLLQKSKIENIKKKY